MAMPPTHIFHSMLVHEALMAVLSSYGYGLLVLYRLKLIRPTTGWFRQKTSLLHTTDRSAAGLF